MHVKTKTHAAVIGPIEFWIPAPGGIPSKKNMLRPRRGGGHYYDKDTKSRLDAMQLEARLKWGGRPPLTDVRIKFRFGISSRRRDLDNSEVSTFDVLVKAGVLRNDSAKHILEQLGRTYDMVLPGNEGVSVTVEGVPAKK
jgi:Holliday junction resolvase RusA-like endonuclease